MTGIVETGDRKQLLFDDTLVAGKSRCRLTLNPPVKAPDPVIREDRPWEKGGLGGDSGVTVMQDKGRYRMWYTVRHTESRGGTRRSRNIRIGAREARGLDTKTLNDLMSRARCFLCYAESRDGVHWEKPDVGLFEYRGSRRNNIVFGDRLGATVFKDPGAPRTERYKMIYGGGPRLPHHHHGGGTARNIYHAVYGAVSPDGLRWTPFARPIMPWYTDTTNVAYWDARIGRYVAFVRWNQDMVYEDGCTRVIEPGGWKYRAIGRSESADFRNFPRPVKVSEPPAKVRWPRETGVDYYNTSAVKYAFAEDAYFLFSSNYYHDWGTLDVQLATSRDGVRYRRWQEPFVPIGPEGNFDSRRTYMATGMLEAGDALLMYYMGGATPHSCARFPRDVVAKMPQVSGIGMVRARVDGFVSQDVDQRGGSLTTVPFRSCGRRLEVNMDAGAGGELRVEILNAHGRPCRGYREANADPAVGNDVRKTITWRGSDDVSRLAGRPVQLRFTGRDVKLYAFRFVG